MPPLLPLLVAALQLAVAAACAASDEPPPQADHAASEVPLPSSDSVRLDIAAPDNAAAREAVPVQLVLHNTSGRAVDLHLDARGEAVPPGTYRLRGEILAEGPPFRSPPRDVRVLPR